MTDSYRTTVSFEASREEFELSWKIADRAMALARDRLHVPFDHRTCAMDIIAAHANGCALRLAELLEAPTFDFVHDVWGIARNIDRKTGEIGGCFLPRYARPASGREA